jgi:methionyl-tRNA formyltransferase
VNGETETGVTTMLIDEGMDTGPLLLARSTPIAPTESAPELEERLAHLGAALLLETVDGLAAGTLTPRPQDASRATLAPLIKKEDGRVAWDQPAPALANRVRGFTPWPGTFVTFAGREVKVLRAEPAGTPARGAPPGTVLAVDREGIVVAAGAATALRLREVQPESRKAMPAAAFAAGTRLVPGDRFA